MGCWGPRGAYKLNPDQTWRSLFCAESMCQNSREFAFLSRVQINIWHCATIQKVDCFWEWCGTLGGSSWGRYTLLPPWLCTFVYGEHLLDRHNPLITEHVIYRTHIKHIHISLMCNFTYLSHLYLLCLIHLLQKQNGRSVGNLHCPQLRLQTSSSNRSTATSSWEWWVDTLQQPTCVN